MTRIRFLPTHADILFMAVMSWCFLAGAHGMEGLLADGDTGVHIRIGDWIRTHRQIPTVDLFGFSKPHETWYAYEWLAGVLFSIANSIAGLKGVTLIAAVLLSLVPVLVAMHSIRRGAAVLIAILLTLLGTNVMNIHFLARPHLFTFVLLAVTVWLVENDRRNPGHQIWMLVPLMALWTNLHGGFFIVFPYLAILIAGCFLEQRPSAARYSILLIACVFATLINPYGWKLHQHVAEYLRSGWIVRVVDEFQSPKFRSEQMICFMALLFCGLAIAGILFQKKRYTEVLWILFFSYCALISVRHATIWVIVMVPLLAEELTGFWPSIRDLIRVDLHVISTWTLAFVIAIALLPVRWPVQFPSDIFPVHLVEKHRDFLKTSRIFTSDQWADYLIWRNYPDQQVFMDARHNYYGEKIGNDFLKLIHATPEWKEVQNRNRFTAFLLPVDGALTALLSELPGWRVLDRDSRAVLFVPNAKSDPESPSPSAFLLPRGYLPQSGSDPDKAP